MRNPFKRDNKMVGEMLRLRRLVDELLDENGELREEIETLESSLDEWSAWADKEFPIQTIEGPGGLNFITEGG